MHETLADMKEHRATGFETASYRKATVKLSMTRGNRRTFGIL